MTYTKHGHHIDGTVLFGPPEGPVARCGGPDRCHQCRTEAQDCDKVKSRVCQHCLADPRYTQLCPDLLKRCPVCGANYTGPRRSREYRALLEAGLVYMEGD